MTTANVGNRSPCFEPFLHPLQCRNPLVDQIRFVSRAEETVSTTELACVLLAPRPSFAGSEYFNGRFMLGKLCNDDLPQALHVRRALFCRKDGNLFRRHIKPFAIVLVIYILIHCIGRQQLLQVSRVNIGDRGYLFRGTRLTISHGPVNASLITDLGKQASERRARVPDDFAGKRIQFFQIQFSHDGMLTSGASDDTPIERRQRMRSSRSSLTSAMIYLSFDGMRPTR